MYIEQLSKFSKGFMVTHRDNATPVRLAMNIMGHAGQGKTELVEDTATSLDMAVVAPRAGELEGGEFTGIPRDQLVDGELVMKYALPAYLPHYKLGEDGKPETWIDDEGVTRKRLNIQLLGAAIKNRKALEKKLGEDWESKVKGVVIFLDEVNRASDDQTKMSIFQLPEKYAIHTYSVPEHCVVMSAMNPPTEEYQVNEMSEEKAFMNRFIHVKAESRVEDWLAWADRNEVSDYVTSFINADTTALQTKNEHFDIDVPITPRSWGKYVDTLIRYFDLRSYEDAIMREVLTGVVGVEYANSFINHMRENMGKIPSAEEIFQNYKKVKKHVVKAVESNAMDFLNQINRNIYTTLQTQESMNKSKVLENVENFEAYLIDLPSEVRVTLVQQLLAFDHVNDQLLGGSDVVYEILNADIERALE